MSHVGLKISSLCIEGCNCEHVQVRPFLSIMKAAKGQTLTRTSPIKYTPHNRHKMDRVARRSALLYTCFTTYRWAQNLEQPLFAHQPSLNLSTQQGPPSTTKHITQTRSHWATKQTAGSSGLGSSKYTHDTHSAAPPASTLGPALPPATLAPAAHV